MQRRTVSRAPVSSNAHVRRLLVVALLIAGLAAACAQHTSTKGAVHILHGGLEVNPVMQRYIDRGID